MFFNRKLSLKKIIVTIFFLFAAVTCIFQVISNLSRGYLLIPPFEIKEPLTWTAFKSSIMPISINHPDGWIASDEPQGIGKDKQVIASITPVHPNYPFVQVAHRKIETNSLQAVVSWGENRIDAPERNRTVENPQTTSLKELEVNGQSAFLRKYNYYNDFSQRVNCNHLYLLDGDDAYTIEMCVNERNDSPELQSVWDQMIESVSLSSS